jgi:hypothetical protein
LGVLTIFALPTKFARINSSISTPFFTKMLDKSIEYIIQVSCGMNGLFDEFAQRICKEATKYLDELSQ